MFCSLQWIGGILNWDQNGAGKRTVCLFYSNWTGHNWIRLRSMLLEISSESNPDILMHVMVIDTAALHECRSKRSFSGTLLSLKGILMVTWITLTSLERWQDSANLLEYLQKYLTMAGFMWFGAQDKYNFALVTHHFSSEAESLKFGDTLKRIRSIDNFQASGFYVRCIITAEWFLPLILYSGFSFYLLNKSSCDEYDHLP